MFILRGSLSLAAYIVSLSTINVNYWTHLVLKKPVNEGLYMCKSKFIKIRIRVNPRQKCTICGQVSLPRVS